MTVSKEEFQSAKDRMDALRGLGHAVSASYDGDRRRVHVELSSGIQIAVPADLLEELSGASSGQLGAIEVTPSGLGLHWPQLDADVYVPAMLQGIFGSRSWMAAQLGAAGGKSTTPAKATAARENGRKGGRPAKSESSVGKTGRNSATGQFMFAKDQPPETSRPRSKTPKKA